MYLIVADPRHMRATGMCNVHHTQSHLASKSDCGVEHESDDCVSRRDIRGSVGVGNRHIDRKAPERHLNEPVRTQPISFTTKKATPMAPQPRLSSLVGPAPV